MQGRNWGRVTAALLAGAVVFLRGGPASADNRWGADYFPNVPLTTQDGATVRLYDDLLKGKSVAINVMYTSARTSARSRPHGSRSCSAFSASAWERTSSSTRSPSIPNGTRRK